MNTSRTALVLACSLGAGLALTGRVLAESWTETEAYYRSEGHADALFLRARAFDRLAQASEGQGLALLQERYRSPRQPHADEERTLIAGALRWVPSDEAGRAALRAWIEAMRGRDPWLEYNALTVLDGERLLALVQDPKEEAWRRAAAAQALARAQYGVRPTVEALSAGLAADALPRKKDDLALLAGGFGAAVLELQRALLDHPDEEDDSAIAPLVDALAALAGHGKLDDTARALLERRLKRLGRERGRGAAADPQRGGTRTGKGLGPTSFMGITVEGRERIVYVLDLSDSMLAPLSGVETERLREASRRRPVTGSGGRTSARDEEQERDPADDLPWDRIRTRFDAAKAFLTRSLAELDPGTKFAVVVFGDEAQLLRSTPKLVDAGRGAKAAAAELAALQPGPPAQGRPNGTLRGQTNLHAAIRLAYQVSTRGVLPLSKAIAPGGPLDHVADTVFVLSDGEPTRDDFPGSGPDRQVQAGTVTKVDPETGATSSSQTAGGMASSDHEGPYRDLDYFRREMERLSLFRWTQVHVVGLGECDEHWGRVLSRIGEGELRIVGGRD